MLNSDHMNSFTVAQLVQNQSVMHIQKMELKVSQWFLIMSTSIDSTRYMLLNYNTFEQSNKGLWCGSCLPYRADKPRVRIRSSQVASWKVRLPRNCMQNLTRMCIQALC